MKPGSLGFWWAHPARLSLRLLLVRVPKTVGNQPGESLRADAKDHGRELLAESLDLADWAIMLTHVPRRQLSLPEVPVCSRLRWHIERLFRLWKGYGNVDEWRSKKPFRVLTELSAKIGAMLIHQWLLYQGCWHDPHRSLFKAAQVLRREINRLMVALFEKEVESRLTSILHLLRLTGGQLHRCKGHSGTDQLL